MPAINPQYLAHKCVEENTVIAQEDIAVGLAVDIHGNLVISPASFSYGFALFDVEAGKPLTVETKGECIGLAGQPLVKGTALSINGVGKLVTAGTGHHVVGRALEDVAAADLYTIILKTEEGILA